MSRRRFPSADLSRRFRHAIEALEERRLLNAGALIGLDLFRADPRFAGIDGRGYSVVVIDHGADLNHPFFGADLDRNGVADRIVYQQDFGDNDANADEESVIGHGTGVAGIIASQDPAYPGVAPGANLIILKLFPSDPLAEQPDMADLEKVLQWVEAHVAQYNIAAVNLSISDEANYAVPPNNQVTSDEFARLANLGVIVVAAAGNDFFSQQSAPGVGYPAADPNVIAVSGVWADNYGAQDFSGAKNDVTGPDHVAAFSQRHPTLTDVFAPAGYITTAAAGGGITAPRGTSFAAPFVTGAAVIAQQLAMEEIGRRLTLSEFRDRLKTTGRIINDGDDEVDNVTNTGADYRRLNLLALGESLLVNPGLPVLSISSLTVDEGDSGTATAKVMVEISRAPRAPVTVQYATIDGSATAADNDYAPTSGLLAFFPGSPLTQTITVPIVGDTRHEPTETFRLILTNANNAAVLNATATITILDNDEPRPWQNPVEPLDVNGNGFVTGLDALVIINKLNSSGPEVLSIPPPAAPFFFYDVTGDGLVTVLDTLRVINHLNSVAAGQLGSAGLQAAAEAPPAGDQSLKLAGGDTPVIASASASAAWYFFWADYAAEHATPEPLNPFRRRR